MRLLLLLLTSFSLLAASCTKEDDGPTTPLDELPPATQPGENIVACLIDGEPWINDENRTGEVNITASYYDLKDWISITGQQIPGSDTTTSQALRLLITPYGIGQADTDSLSCTFIQYPITGNRVDNFAVGNDNNLTVTYFSLEDRIIAGNFNYEVISKNRLDTIRITEGRFDVTFY